MMVSSRRQFGQQVLGSLVLAGAWPGLLQASATSLDKAELTPDLALAKLMAGHQRFITQQRHFPHQDFQQIQAMSQVQSPMAAILCCADARLVPDIIFDQGIGDLFVVRVAGNLAMTEEIASEEYAVSVLNTPLIMVLGHSNCGAVTAVVAGKPLPGVMSSLATAIQPALAIAAEQPGDFLTHVIQANVHQQVQKLQDSPVLSERINQGQLKIVPAHYDLETAQVSLL